MAKMHERQKHYDDLRRQYRRHQQLREWAVLLVMLLIIVAAIFALAGRARGACGPAGYTVSVDGASGVAVKYGGDSRWVVTCQHGNVQVGNRYVIRAQGSQTTGTVVAIGEGGADCALIRTDAAASCYVEVAEAEPEIGAVVRLCGYTNGGPLQCREGRVSGYNSPIVATAQGYTNPGDSGGPLLDSSGRLVGILSGQPGGPMVYCRLYPIRRMLDCVAPNRPGTVAPNRPGTIIPHAPVQQSPRPNLPPSYQPGTDAGKDAAGWSSAGQINWRAELDALKAGKQDKGEYLTRADFEASMKDLATDVVELQQANDGLTKSDGPVATFIGQRLDAIRHAVDARIDERLRPIDDKLADVQRSLAVRLAGHTASLLGVSIPPALTTAGAVLGGPVGLIGAGLAYWRLKKRIDGKKTSQPAVPASGAGGPESTTFHNKR